MFGILGEIFVFLIITIAGYFIETNRRVNKILVDDSHREAAETLLERGAELAITYAEKFGKKGGRMQVALDFINKYLEKLNIKEFSKDFIEQMIEAKLQEKKENG